VLPAEEIAEVFGIDTDVDAITVEQLYEPVALASRSIWRVRVADRSAVLKLVAHSDGGSVNWRSGADPSHWYYWRREVLAYESGLLASLPGRLRAPRCYAATARDDGGVALWLEDLGGASAAAWPIERYGAAARHLGETQGSYLVSRPLPTDAWLSRGWLRSYLAQREGDLALLEEPVAASFPKATIAAAIALREDRAQELFDERTALRIARVGAYRDRPAEQEIDQGFDPPGDVVFDHDFLPLQLDVRAVVRDAGDSRRKAPFLRLSIRSV